MSLLLGHEPSQKWWLGMQSHFCVKHIFCYVRLSQGCDNDASTTVGECVTCYTDVELTEEEYCPKYDGWETCYSTYDQSKTCTIGLLVLQF